MTKFQAGTIHISQVMDRQVHAIGEAIRPPGYIIVQNSVPWSHVCVKLSNRTVSKYSSRFNLLYWAAGSTDKAQMAQSQIHVLCTAKSNN